MLKFEWCQNCNTLCCIYNVQVQVLFKFYKLFRHEDENEKNLLRVWIRFSDKPNLFTSLKQSKVDLSMFGFICWTGMSPNMG